MRVIGLSKGFRDVLALQDVSLDMNDGEYVSIIGPSGCGKSTLLKCIAGIIKQDSGEIFIGDREVTSLPPEDRQLGYMFQEIALFPHMSVLQNVGYGPRVRGKDRRSSREFVGQIMEMARLAVGSETYPDELSGGASQKAALARAIAAEPELMLLDEPLGALDAHVRAALRYELRRLVKELQLTAIHVTHDQEEAMSISDRLVIMKAGRIVEVGTPLELYLTPKRLFTANFLGEANFFQATVKDCTAYQVTASVNGWTLNFAGSGYASGERVVLAARPESVILTPADRQASQEWIGTVRDRMLLGDCIRMEIGMNNNLTVIAQTPNRGLLGMVDRGETVRIDFSVGSILSYRWPAEGLDAELALE